DASTSECATGVCAPDGTSCEGGCDAAVCGDANYCDASGACIDKLTDGEACSAAEQCASGNCVDGICCNTLCEGLCESCAEAGSVGTCQVLAGNPMPARGSCDGAGPCKGQCDGENGGACAYPGAATECGAASCTAGQATS